jgi:hypothetical protein
MAPQRFLTLFAVVSMAATAALLLGMHGGGVARTIATGLVGLIALIGIAVLVRVVIVIERARSRR